jgi:hypothetical protein
VSEELANHCANRVVFAPSVVESPSLFRFEANGVPAPAAFEIKFLLTEKQAQEVQTRLSGRLALDSHADPALGGAYRTTSLYTETPDFAVFRRVGEYGTSKFRVRRYGSSGPVFLERKDKDGDRVHKARISASAADLADLSVGRTTAQGLSGWFRDEIARRQLAPICRISYDRVAYLGTAESGAVRATFDRRVRGETTTQWDVVPVGEATELLPGLVICEFKYRLALPHLFKEIIATLGLQSTPCSKYRRFIASTGIARPDDTVANGGAANA